MLRGQKTGFNFPPSDGPFLGKLQSRLKQHSPHDLSAAEKAEFTEAADECRRIADCDENPHSGWAQRLAEDSEGLIDDADDGCDFDPHSDLAEIPNAARAMDDEFAMTIRDAGSEPVSFAVVRDGVPIRVGVRTLRNRADGEAQRTVGVAS